VLPTQLVLSQPLLTLLAPTEWHQLLQLAVLHSSCLLLLLHC
jgi:hypothetical protein